jgi:hypothetical protein
VYALLFSLIQGTCSAHNFVVGTSHSVLLPRGQPALLSFFGFSLSLQANVGLVP